MHPEVARQHAVTAGRADRTGARGVVPPGIVAHERAEIVVRLTALAGQLLLHDELLALELGGHAASELDPFHHRVEVLTSGIGAFAEVAEVHGGRIARISRTERDLDRKTTRL